MDETRESFSQTSVKLARNPLGIIALFIFLVYAIAGIVFSSTAQGPERTILVLFLVLFPLFVLFAFFVLVTRYHDKLYAPSDFKDDHYFVALIEKRISDSPTVRQISQRVDILADIERANALVFQGINLYDLKDWRAALQYFDEALKVYPAHTVALAKKSGCLKRLGDVAGALKVINRVLEIEPNSELGFYNRACYRALLRHSKSEVLADLRRAIELFPHNRRIAMADDDFASLKQDPDFISLFA
jgi:tetratricopeptide (TPR) repeat protein